MASGVLSGQRVLPRIDPRQVKALVSLETLSCARTGTRSTTIPACNSVEAGNKVVSAASVERRTTYDGIAYCDMNERQELGERERRPERQILGPRGVQSSRMSRTHGSYVAGCDWLTGI